MDETEYKKFEEFQGIKLDILTKLKKGTVLLKLFEHSIPDWLVETLEKELGENWEKMMVRLMNKRQLSACQFFENLNKTLNRKNQNTKM